MTSAIAVLTYNRVKALENIVTGLDRHCASYPRAIFDDHSAKDDTAAALMAARTTEPVYQHDWMAKRFKAKLKTSELADPPEWNVFLGSRNLGVAAASNKAIRWFMEETTADHLCICNDDLTINADFVDHYAKGHERLRMHLFCFCDFTSETYKWAPIRVKAADGSDWNLKLLPRMTGIMMSLTRELVGRIGYYDVSFGKFGEEHCDYTNRARFAGAMRLQDRDLHCLDIDTGSPPMLQHLEVESSIQTLEKPALDRTAYAAMQNASRLYMFTAWHRPYALYRPRFAGAYEAGGIPVAEMRSYPLAIQ